MSSFRATPRDLENINSLTLAFGGVTKTKVISIALEEAATKKQRPAIYPQLPPSEQLDALIEAVKEFVMMFKDADGSFWPDHLPGESRERREAVDKARLDTKTILDLLWPKVNAVRVLLAVVNGAKSEDSQYLEKLNAAAEELIHWQKQFLGRSKDVALPSVNREDFSLTAEMFTLILDLLTRAGIRATEGRSRSGNANQRKSPT